MKTQLKLAAAVTMMTVLAGCASLTDINAVDTTRNIDATGASAFNKALSSDYAAYAVFEAESEGEWAHGGAFARKAIQAAKNEAVAPEDVSKWTIAADRAAVLNKARAEMLAKFAAGGQKSHPNFAGRAQGQFDCWVEEEAEGVTNSDCKANHQAAIAKIKTTPPMAAVHKPAPMMAIPPFVIYFGFDSAALDDAAKRIVNSVSKQSGQSKAKRIILTGHADRSGNVDYNLALSKRRVKAVSDALTARGVSGAVITTSSFGETRPNVATGDNKREKLNRRVKIILKR